MMRQLFEKIVLVATLTTVLPVVEAAERVDANRIAACANEADDARRLACYDSAVKAPAPQEATAASSPPATAKPAAAPPSAPPVVVPKEEDFGLAGSAVAKQRRNEQERQESKDEVGSISAQVTDISSRPLGERVVTLDNGQVWVQKNPDARFLVKVGDRVTIHAGMLGSYRLVNGKRMTQVTRVK